ncbi:MAG TPA: 4a-hydroxytetrahydrobiopterin dehydratase [Solirubrobacteraceae bacterium]|jgi:4a-hydroxytetrahydrobiopterin dehydratase|nr:4a-hydroxytetrahydrobiopterin dehydratase [Solirubrobacteraceae bacterium]
MSVLSEEQIEQQLADVPNWRRAGDAEIVHERTLEDFMDAVAFVDRVAAIAEEANHHPDILLHGWNKVRLTLSTHSEGALTDADFALAARIDSLA